MDPKPRKRLSEPIVNSCEPASLVLDNQIIDELLFRGDFPQYFSAEERTYEAVVEAVRKKREADEAAE